MTFLPARPSADDCAKFIAFVTTDAPFSDPRWKAAFDVVERCCKAENEKRETEHMLRRVAKGLLDDGEFVPRELETYLPEDEEPDTGPIFDEDKGGRA